jgi:hypothetical protein
VQKGTISPCIYAINAGTPLAIFLFNVAFGQSGKHCTNNLKVKERMI